MKKDILYTDGVIAVREKYLLGDRLQRMCEGTAEEAYRILQEANFGSGAEVEGGDVVERCENLIVAEERGLDAFIREYSPSDTLLQFLLAPRDFFNAKAMVKAKYLNCSYEKMIASEGMFTEKEIADAVYNGNYPQHMPQLLRQTIEKSTQNIESDANGADIGDLFEKATFKYLFSLVKWDMKLKKLLVRKVDMTNILCVLRSGSMEEAQKHFIEGGSLKEDKFACLLTMNDVKKDNVFKGTVYEQFVSVAVTAFALRKPQTEAEKMLASLELSQYYSARYNLKGNETFLYYVLRKRTECINVRIILVCLSAGMDSNAIKRRLRIGGGNL